MTNDSRRHFLTGGAVAAVGVVASAVAPGPAEAQAATETILCRTYYPNDALAHAIVKAWRDPAYKSRLLSFPTNDYARPQPGSGAALAEAGYSIQNPIVVTEAQYLDYLNFVQNKIPASFFVLPEPRASSTRDLDAARSAMALTCYGM
jgi:hypothetical protein